MTAQELKISILQLALQGKLVPQNSGDKPVSELLQLISAKKSELISCGELKKEKPLPVIDETEIIFDIPNSWKWVRLGDYCIDSFSGKSPIYSKTPTPFIVIGQAANQQGGLDYSQVKYTVSDFWNAMDKKYFIRKHDVLLNTLGHGTLGRSGIVNNLKTEMLTDGHLFVFRTLSEITSKYFYYYLQYKRTEIERSANGSTNQTFLSLKKTGLWLVPVPPLEEQKRIVTKIEELLPYVEEYDKVEKRLLELNDEFPDKLRKSILQQAIQGRLTERHPDDKPACEILNRIREEKAKLIAEKKIKKEKTLSPIMDDEKLFDIPDTWEWCRIGDIFVTSSGTTPSRSNSKYYENGVYNWVRTTDLNNSVLCSCEIKVSDIAFNECRLSIIPRNSVCIAMYGGAGTIGKNALVDFDTTINQSVCAIHPNELIDMKYVQIYMHFYRPFWMLEASGARQDPNINQVIIKNALIAIPPLAEQKRIVSRVEELLAVCDKLK